MQLYSNSVSVLIAPRYELPFGDQALATRRDVLAALGGYPDVPILEESSRVALLVIKILSKSPVII